MEDLFFRNNLDQTGQHYMIDKALIKFIIDEAMLEKDDVVLEIGYGHGALTGELVKKSKVVAIDIEKNDLKIDKKHSKNLKLLTGNILEKIGDIKFTKIVSNIPYNISEPLMRKLFKIDFDLCILTVGKNFANILSTSDKDNRIGIIANSFYDVEVLKIVKPNAFRPSPKVDSAVIRIEPKKLEDLSKADVVLRGLIFLDDKKLKNAFISLARDVTKKKISEKLSDSGIIFFDKKIYALTNQEFSELMTFIENFSDQA